MFSFIKFYKNNNIYKFIKIYNNIICNTCVVMNWVLAGYRMA